MPMRGRRPSERGRLRAGLAAPRRRLRVQDLRRPRGSSGAAASAARRAQAEHRLRPGRAGAARGRPTTTGAPQRWLRALGASWDARNRAGDVFSSSGAAEADCPPTRSRHPTNGRRGGSSSRDPRSDELSAPLPPVAPARRAARGAGRRMSTRFASRVRQTARPRQRHRPIRPRRTMTGSEHHHPESPDGEPQCQSKGQRGACEAGEHRRPPTHRAPFSSRRPTPPRARRCSCRLQWRNSSRTGSMAAQHQPICGRQGPSACPTSTGLRCPPSVRAADLSPECARPKGRERRPWLPMQLPEMAGRGGEGPSSSSSCAEHVCRA